MIFFFLRPTGLTGKSRPTFEHRSFILAADIIAKRKLRLAAGS